MSDKMQTLPMRIHKGLVIQALRRWPKDHAKFVPGFRNAREAIKALEAHPAEWIVDGVLRVEKVPA